MKMHRRDFVRLAGAGLAAGASSAPLPSHAEITQTTVSQGRPVAPRKALMKVGTQHDSSDEVLGILAALGVNHICSRLPSARLDDRVVGGGLDATARAGRAVRHHARHGAAAAELEPDRPG